MDLFIKYAEIETVYNALAEKKEALREKIVSQMKKNKQEKMETAYGIFTVAKRTNYEYTQKIAKLLMNVKLAKVKEEQQGKATKVESEYLRYSVLKE